MGMQAVGTRTKSGTKNQSGMKKTVGLKKKNMTAQVGKRPKTQSGRKPKNGKERTITTAHKIKVVHLGVPSLNGRTLQMMAAVTDRLGRPGRARATIAAQPGKAQIPGKNPIGQQEI